MATTYQVVGEVYFAAGDTAPSGGGGLEAPIGSLFNDTVTGITYKKTDTADTDWTELAETESFTGTFGDTVTWNAGTPPADVVQGISWARSGDVVTVTFRLVAGTPGVNVTGCTFPLPAALPLPAVGLASGINEIVVFGIGYVEADLVTNSGIAVPGAWISKSNVEAYTVNIEGSLAFGAAVAVGQFSYVAS
jgi:hypothetical protein